MNRRWIRSLGLIGAGVGFSLGLKAWWQRQRAMSLQDQVVLVTGGSRGLGLALAQEFVRQGARVAICARQREELEQARQKLVDGRAEVLALRCDVTDQEQIERMIDQVVAHFGGIDILVNNAGIITVGPLETMKLHDFEEAMSVMFWGPVYASLAALPHMRAQGSGRIVNITSIGGKVSVPHLLPYASAKFAAVGFSEGLHAALAKEGIAVLTVVPGLMRTGSHVNAFMKGKHAAEYTWFGLMATLPLTVTSAAHAARRIVWATRTGATEIVITPQAQLLERFHGLFPGLTTRLLGLVNRLLPGAQEGESTALKGKESRTPAATLVTGLGEPAAHRYNQYEEEAHEGEIKI